jgi:CheY-like chemotaxis protein
MKKIKEQKNNNKKAYISEDKLKKTQTGLLRALLIEDNPLIQQIHCKYLKNLHYTVEIATTQQQALQYAFSQRYDLVMTDLGLSDNRNETIIISLRQAPSINRETPLIIVTAYTNPDLKSRCFSAGANAFIVKPLAKTLLEATVKKLCTHPSHRTSSFSAQ